MPHRTQDAQAASAKARTVAGLDDCDWQYVGPGGVWCCMPPDTSMRLSDAYRVYHAGGPETLSLNIGQYQYDFDFSSMKQRNTRTGVARDIRVSFDIPEHWEIDDETLLEQHLEALPMRELPRRDEIPGGFSEGQKALSRGVRTGVDRRFSCVWQRGRRMNARSPESGGPGSRRACAGVWEALAARGSLTSEVEAAAGRLLRSLGNSGISVFFEFLSRRSFDATSTHIPR